MLMTVVIMFRAVRSSESSFFSSLTLIYKISDVNFNCGNV